MYCRYKETKWCGEPVCEGGCRGDAIRLSVEREEWRAEYVEKAAAIKLRFHHLPRWVREELASMRSRSVRDFSILDKPVFTWSEVHCTVKAKAIVAGFDDWRVHDTIGVLKAFTFGLIEGIEIVQHELNLPRQPGASPMLGHPYGKTHRPLLAKGGFYEGLVDLLEKEGISMADGVSDATAYKTGEFVVAVMQLFDTLRQSQQKEEAHG